MSLAADRLLPANSSHPNHLHRSKAIRHAPWGGFAGFQASQHAFHAVHKVDQLSKVSFSFLLQNKRLLSPNAFKSRILKYCLSHIIDDSRWGVSRHSASAHKSTAFFEEKCPAQRVESSSFCAIEFFALKPATPDIAVIAYQSAPLEYGVVVVREKLRYSNFPILLQLQSDKDERRDQSGNAD